MHLLSLDQQELQRLSQNNHFYGHIDLSKGKMAYFKSTDTFAIN